MTDLILHKHEKYITEDLGYYFSGKRDINNQVRPSQDIYSLTLNSQHFNIDYNDGKVGNLFFPIPAFSVDRIYLGISFPLFANNWGSSFLRYLLTRIKPNGCIILPVYPEMQASEKNLWSRSILEDSFLSRSRWKGTSNIWAENDGVMSIRVGRKWPAMIRSTAKYLFAQGTHIIVRNSLKNSAVSTSESLFKLGNIYWNNANNAAILETIIQDHFGRKQAVSLCDLGDSNGLAAIECLLSDYINIKQAICFTTENEDLIDYKLLLNSFHHEIHNRYSPINSSKLDTLALLASFDVICIIDCLSTYDSQTDIEQLLLKAWQKVTVGGLLIIKDEQNINDNIKSLLASFGSINYYSSIVASKIIDDEQISHYSSKIEQELVIESRDKNQAFHIIEKLT
jgi:hypothetical protein